MKPFTVYIASMFSDKDRVKQRAGELALSGIACSSRWAFEDIPHNATMQDCSEEYLRETAAIDLDDILKAEKIVMTVPDYKMLVDVPITTSSRGGRHFEAGFVYGLIFMEKMSGNTRHRELIILGKPENVFHMLDGIGAAARYPVIKNFKTWPEVVEYLKEEQDVYERNGSN